MARGFHLLIPFARQHLLKFGFQHQPASANANGGYLTLLRGFVGRASSNPENLRCLVDLKCLALRWFCW